MYKSLETQDVILSTPTESKNVHFYAFANNYL